MTCITPTTAFWATDAGDVLVEYDDPAGPWALFRVTQPSGSVPGGVETVPTFAGRCARIGRAEAVAVAARLNWGHDAVGEDTIAAVERRITNIALKYRWAATRTR